LISAGFLGNAVISAQSPRAPVERYHPTTRIPPSLETVLKQVTPGNDAFPEEKVAGEIADVLSQLSTTLKRRADRPPDAADLLLAPEFRGGRLVPPDEAPTSVSGSLQIFPAKSLSRDLVLDRATFAKEFAALLADFQSIRTAEFLITRIEVDRKSEPRATTVVRFDLAGPGKGSSLAERIGHWEMRWQPGAGGKWRVIEWTTLDHLHSRALTPVFSEVTQTALGSNRSFLQQLVPGLDYWASHLDAVFMPRGMGHHGVSVGDIDGDGFDDIYVSQPEGLPNRLFRNKGDGTFEDLTESAGVAILDRTSQSLFADVDNDGDQDLILLTRTGPLLFVNDGKAHFTRNPDAFQFKQPLQGSLTSAAIGDYDRDGFLDIYLCAYGYFIGVSEDKAGPPAPYHDALNGSPNVLLRNDGHGRFVEVTDEVGLDQDNDRFSFAAAWGDYDEDGWPDLLVANDFGRKNLYHNEGLVNGRLHFKDVARAAGVEDYGAGMSATFVDYDNDGHLDIYTGKLWTAAGQRVTSQPGFKPDEPFEIRDVYRRHTRGNSLFKNNGNGTFADVTVTAGAEFGRWAWSSDAFDFDNDGWNDLYVVNGMFTRDDEDPSVDVDSFFWRQVVAQSPMERKAGTPYDDGWRATNRILLNDGAQAQHERNVLLRNDGRGGFEDVSGTVGLDLDQDGRAFSVFDYDGDGRPDVVLLAARSSPQLRLFRNRFGAGHAALALRLTGTKSNRDAIGARVTVEADQVRPTRVLMAGSGFVSQHSKELLFGLGRSTRIAKVTITWPSGLVQTLRDVPIDRRVYVEEGKDDLRAEPFRKAGATAPASVTTVAVAAPTSAGVWLYQPFPAPDFALRDLDGQERALTGRAGRPALVLFWATWAPPSVEAFKALARQREALEAAGVSVVAVSVDAREDEAKVREAARGAGVPVAIATEEVAGAWNVLHNHLFSRRGDLILPTLFLVSGRGEIVKLYRDPGAFPALAEDLRTIDASQAERLARALPFPGNPYSSPAARSYFQYGLELSEQGFDVPALGAFEQVAKADPTAAAFFNLGTLYMKAGRTPQAETAFGRALELQPTHYESANSLGALLAQKGDLPRAIERFKAALAVRPDFPDALNNLGYALYQGGQADQAFELYKKALSYRPDFAQALNNLGIYYGQGGDLERASLAFKKAVEADPGYGEAGNNLALVLAAQGDTAGATLVLQRLIAATPEFEPAYVTLSRVYLQAGRRRDAVQVLELLLQRNPKNAAALETLQKLRSGS